MRHAPVTTPLGELWVVADEPRRPSEYAEVVVGVYFPRHWTRPDQASWGERSRPDGVIGECASELNSFLRGSTTTFTTPVELRGTDFHQAVWGLLRQIPFGQTRSYGQLAAELGGSIPGAASVGGGAANRAKVGAQPVGQAVGHNPISIIVPCHRVVGADGSLTGYAGGLDRKQFLLELEGACEPGLFSQTVFAQS